jgi:tRNA pseudouridine55 synthase
VRRKNRNSAGVGGVLLLDKPSGISSQAAVTRVKTLLGADKAGHTGTLDPAASGLLPICLGAATRFSHLLLDSDKRYQARIRLGIATATGDLEGEVIARTPTDGIGRERILRALAGFRGEILQTPPMHSALKRDGKPLYAYARQGQTLERAPRRVRIDRLELLRIEDADLDIDVSCSKGTYIRVLAEDIGRELGCGACLAALRRIGSGHFGLEQAIGLDALARMEPEARYARLLPVDALVAALPRADLDSAQAAHVALGQAVTGVHCGAAGAVRLYGPAGRFLGVGEFTPPDRLAPRRLLAAAPEGTASSRASDANA